MSHIVPLRTIKLFIFGALLVLLPVVLQPRVPVTTRLIISDYSIQTLHGVVTTQFSYHAQSIDFTQAPTCYPCPQRPAIENNCMEPPSHPFRCRSSRCSESFLTQARCTRHEDNCSHIRAKAKRDWEQAQVVEEDQKRRRLDPSPASSATVASVTRPAPDPSVRRTRRRALDHDLNAVSGISSSTSQPENREVDVSIFSTRSPINL